MNDYVDPNYGPAGVSGGIQLIPIENHSSDVTELRQLMHERNVAVAERNTLRQRLELAQIRINDCDARIRQGMFEMFGTDLDDVAAFMRGNIVSSVPLAAPGDDVEIITDGIKQFIREHGPTKKRPLLIHLAQQPATRDALRGRPQLSEKVLRALIHEGTVLRNGQRGGCRYSLPGAVG